jgi:hypothetical protein
MYSSNKSSPTPQALGVEEIKNQTITEDRDDYSVDLTEGERHTKSRDKPEMKSPNNIED